MKNLFTLCLALILCLSICACTPQISEPEVTSSITNSSSQIENEDTSSVSESSALLQSSAEESEPKDILDYLYKPDKSELGAVGKINTDQEYKTDEEKIIYDFFVRVYSSLAALEMKNFDDVLIKSDENLLILGALKYRIASFCDDKYYFKTGVNLDFYDMTLTTDNGFLKFDFWVKSTVDEGKAHIHYNAVVNPEEMKIVSIHEIQQGTFPTWESVFKEKYDAYVVEHGNELSIEEITDEVIRQEFLN